MNPTHELTIISLDNKFNYDASLEIRHVIHGQMPWQSEDNILDSVRHIYGVIRRLELYLLMYSPKDYPEHDDPFIVHGNLNSGRIDRMGALFYGSLTKSDKLSELIQQYGGRAEDMAEMIDKVYTKNNSHDVRIILTNIGQVNEVRDSEPLVKLVSNNL